MPDYLVFGSCLRSELPFPELAEARDHEPRWNLRLAALEPSDDDEVLSDSYLSSSCHIRISRRKGMLRYSHSCGGTFEISPDGRDIVFDAGQAADTNTARTDLVARLLLMYADHERVTWLHGSAAQIGGTAIAFLGPSGAGKSTLALALARAGAKHICDDILPIEAGEHPVVWPSDRTIRLNDDSRTRLASQTGAVRRESDGKFVVTHCSLENDDGRTKGCTDPRVELAALYLLAPPTDGAGEVAQNGTTRRLIPPTAAMPHLIQHMRLGAVIGAEYPARAMQQLGAILARVPVFELSVPRDWTRLGDAVRQLSEWHAHSNTAATELRESA